MPTVSPHSALSTAWSLALSWSHHQICVSHRYSLILSSHFFFISKWKQYDIIHSSPCFLLRCSVILPSSPPYPESVLWWSSRKGEWSRAAHGGTFFYVFPSWPIHCSPNPHQEFKWTQHTITLSLQIPDLYLTESEENRIGNSSEFLHILLIHCPGRNRHQLSSCPGSWQSYSSWTDHRHLYLV